MTEQLSPVELRITDNLQDLLEVLPADIRESIRPRDDWGELLEVVMDLGRRPEARFESQAVYLTERLVEEEDLDYVTSRLSPFGKDNRSGIERTLHRISAMRNRSGRVVGLTCRVGRAVYGTIDIIRDVVETGKSILLLGRPGVGKTTKLREIARVLSEEFLKRVVIVDTSNEIAGDGDIPHASIGRARRMQVPEPSLQHQVMIEAVENHMPEVIVIDEIGTEQEAFAARTIAERGVQLVGTAHGNTLENLLMNPTLSDLLGGIQSVTLGDEEARRRGTQKTVLERKAPPTFEIVIELLNKDALAIHRDLEDTVDQMLRGRQPRPEMRERGEDGEITVVKASIQASPIAEAPVEATVTESPQPALLGDRKGVVRVFPYGVSRSRLDKAIRALHVPALLSKTWQDADAIIALKAHVRREPTRLRQAIESGRPTFIIRSNTQFQIEGVLREMFGVDQKETAATALDEARAAIERVRTSGDAVELASQSAYIRRLQHRLVEAADLESYSLGSDPNRRVCVTTT